MVCKSRGSKLFIAIATSSGGIIISPYPTSNTALPNQVSVTSNLQDLAGHADGVTGITDRRRTGLIFSPAPYTALVHSG